MGLSLSNEIGYQRRQFSTDTWTWEIRPIADKQIGRWYFSVNPTLDRSFHGESVNEGVVFSPNFKFSYDFTKKILLLTEPRDLSGACNQDQGMPPILLIAMIRP